jgi:hypothetical protein
VIEAEAETEAAEEQAAENVETASSVSENYPSEVNVPVDFAAFMYGQKPVPFTDTSLSTERETQPSPTEEPEIEPLDDPTDGSDDPAWAPRA